MSSSAEARTIRPCEFEVAGFVGAAEGLGRVGAVLFVPLGGSGEVSRGEFGIGSVELGAEELGKQVVVAVPAAVIVEGDHERVRAFQLLEHLARVVNPEDGVAQRRRHLRQDRGREQEAPTLLPSPGRASPRRGSRRSRVGLPLMVWASPAADTGSCQGVQGECDPGRPSLRPLAQKPESLLGQACAAASRRARVPHRHRGRADRLGSRVGSPATRRRASGSRTSVRVRSTTWDGGRTSSSR